jgi:23S rRNA U2552 (ribose-2'-O)-methylase RlmE/FtsJ
MKSLNEIYQNYQSPEHHGDKGTTHTYIDEYERLLKDYRIGSNVLEIGIYYGESLKMWSEYFINSKICAVDINGERIQDLINDGQYNIIISDATKIEFLEKIKDETFDVIIDDGSHLINHQIKSFNILKDKMKPGGIYIIEDVNNLDSTINVYKELHKNIEIIDNRHIKNRFDDVLIIYKF